MTYQHPPGFTVPDPRHNDPLTAEYIQRAVNQIIGVVDGLVDPILNADIDPDDKIALLTSHLLNATLIFQDCIASRYYGPELEELLSATAPD